MTYFVVLDISKAFDKVWHKGLLLKLASYGISGNVLGVIESFLSDRSLKVAMGRLLRPTRSMLVSHKVLCLGPHFS